MIGYRITRGPCSGHWGPLLSVTAPVENIGLDKECMYLTQAFSRHDMDLRNTKERMSIGLCKSSLYDFSSWNLIA